MLQKIKVILTALPTYLSLATVVLTVLASEILPLLPDNIAATIAGLVALGLAWVAAIINVIRRLTPVLPGEQGLLPVEAEQAVRPPIYD